MTYPEDSKIKETYYAVSDKYNKGDNWNLRIVAEELGCPIDYVRRVLAELDEKGEL